MLAAALRTAYPEVEFSLQWDPERLHVRVLNVPYETLARDSQAVDSGMRPNQPNMLVGIVRECLRHASPPPGSLWISARQRDGHWVQDREDWLQWRAFDAYSRGTVAGQVKGQEPPRGLPLHYRAADQAHAAAAARLRETLHRAYPESEFSWAWDSTRLHVTVHSVPPPTAGAPASGGQSPTGVSAMWHDIIRLCLQTPSPPTAELWTTFRQSDGSWGQERAAWRGYERAFGVVTPRPHPKG